MLSDQNKDKLAYIDLFVQFSARVEHWLKRVIIVLLLSLVFLQLLLQSTEIRYYLTTIERLEDRTVEFEYGE